MKYLVNYLNKRFFSKDYQIYHSKSLDGLRGLAILFVLLSHSSNSDLFFYEFLNFKKTGKIGVYLFFVLSSYLLDRQILLTLEQNKASGNYWKNYILRRALRIYPLFIISLLFYFTLCKNGIIRDNWDMNKLISNILLIKGNFIYWSISVEFKYYIISPFIILIIHTYFKNDLQKTVLFIISLMIVSFSITYYFHLPLSSIIRFLPVFLIGTLSAIFEVKKKDVFVRIINTPLFKYVGPLSMMIIVLSIPYYFQKITGYFIYNVTAHYYCPYAVLFGILIYSTKSESNITRSIFEFKPLRFLGVISYSLYLFHMFFLYYAKSIEITEFTRIYVFFILSIIFSCICYLFIEKPISKISFHNMHKKISRYCREIN